MKYLTNILQGLGFAVRRANLKRKSIEVSRRLSKNDLIAKINLDKTGGVNVTLDSEDNGLCFHDEINYKRSLNVILHTLSDVYQNPGIYNFPEQKDVTPGGKFTVHYTPKKFKRVA